MGRAYPGRVRRVKRGPTSTAYFESSSQSYTLSHSLLSEEVQQLRNEMREMQIRMDDRFAQLEVQVTQLVHLLRDHVPPEALVNIAAPAPPPAPPA